MPLRPRRIAPALLLLALAGTAVAPCLCREPDPPRGARLTGPVPSEPETPPADPKADAPDQPSYLPDRVPTPPAEPPMPPMPPGTSGTPGRLEQPEALPPPDPPSDPPPARKLPSQLGPPAAPDQPATPPPTPAAEPPTNGISWPEPASVPALADPSKGALPITLPAALQLAGVRPVDIEVAAQRIKVAAALLERAQWQWLPTIYLGADYFRHDGQLQDVVGNVFGTSKSSLLLGAGPSMVFQTSDAIFGPLAARQDLRAREALLQAARNDALLAVAEAYFNVQQARGELVGAEVTAKHAEELARRTDQLAPGLVPPVEAVRARAELAKRMQAVAAAREHWRVSSADLARVLRLQQGVLVQPAEPPFLEMTLLKLDMPVDDLIPVGLTNRPELAAQQALVQATLQRLRQEKLRPLMPSVLLRGASTPVTGTLAGGYFGGGTNGRVGDFSARSDFDLQVVWTLENLGFGNRAKVREKRAENELAMLELLKVQDRVAAEVAQAYAQAQEAAVRVRESEVGLKLAADSVEKNFAGLNETRRLEGKVVLLVIRPQEVVAAIQALAQANADYYAAVADYDRAQFRLYRALGHPAQLVAPSACACCP